MNARGRDQPRIPLTRLRHFLALSRLRKPECDERLLAFLWDRLGGGSTALYMSILAQLLEKGLLSRDSSRLRLSADVHMRLEKPLFSILSPAAVGHTEYFISEYYRNAFATTGLIQDLDNYVYHSLASGNFQSPYEYIFDGERLREWHHKGQSLELEAVLRQLHDRWFVLSKKDTSSPAERALQGAKIKIELGHVCNDLSKHAECLTCMLEAERLLEAVAAAFVDEEHELRRKLWHLSGISHSIMGNMDLCMHYYSRIVLDAAETQKMAWLDALSLGYFAYEEKFRNMAKAISLGRTALTLSQDVKDRSTIVKNMCSLAQMLLFDRQADAAEAVLKNADDVCQHEVDKRELGRLLVNSATLYIFRKDHAAALERLSAARASNTRTGDRRRAGLATAYEAIVEHKQGDHTKARALLVSAIRQHTNVSAWREVLYEALTYLYWKKGSGMPQYDGAGFFRDAIERLPEFQESLLRVSKHGHFAIFSEFWWKRYKPLLLN